MRNTRRVFSLFLFLWSLSFLASPAIAQSDKKDTAAEEQKRRQEIERKTLLLLDEIVAASSSLKLPENRIFVLTSAANLVWPHDEKRGRTICWEAINTLNTATSTSSSTNGRSNNTAYFDVFSSRRQILSIAAKRDAQFALELLHASRQIAPESVDQNWIATERDLEQEIASAAVERDPKRALQLARESLSKGLSLSLLNLLFQVNQKDSELGTKFAGEVIDKMRTAQIRDLNAYIAQLLLMTSRAVKENSSRSL